jgi:hypothetical protein
MTPTNNQMKAEAATLTLQERVAVAETHLTGVFDKLDRLERAVTDIQRTVWIANGAVAVVVLLVQMFIRHG